MRLRYLQAMGLSSWRFRAEPSAPLYYVYKLYNAEKQLVAQLFADATLQTEEERSLTENIAKATKWTVCEVLERGSRMVDDIESTCRVVILLGTDVAKQVIRKSAMITALRNEQHHFNHIPVIVSYSPAELLVDKSLKSAVWQDVQRAMSVKST